jgi:hypothetical protein
MKDLSIRHQIIHDIRFLSPELLSQAYQYLELLKATKYDKKGTWKSYIGCISDQEATTQKELIDKEFENIEGEW